MYRFLSLRLFFSFCIVFFKTSTIFSGSLDEMTHSEKIQVKCLFEHLFKQEPFAYTLFFDKPIAFSEILYPELPASILIKSMNVSEYAHLIMFPRLSSKYFETAWNIWNKYQDLLLNKQKYILTKKKINGKPIIMIVNINKFNNYFYKYNNLFSDSCLDYNLVLKKN